jgi:hypothetical protein
MLSMNIVETFTINLTYHERQTNKFFMIFDWHRHEQCRRLIVDANVCAWFVFVTIRIYFDVRKKIRNATESDSIIRLTRIVTSRDLVPIASGSADLTTVWSTIVNSSVILTSRCTTACTSWCISRHIRLNTLIGTGLAGSTCTQRASWWTTINPVFLFDLIITAWIWIDIPRTAEWSTSWFNGTDAAKASTVNLSQCSLK